MRLKKERRFFRSSSLFAFLDRLCRRESPAKQSENMPKVTSARKSAQPLPQQPRATTSPLPTDQTGSTSASANHHSVGYPSYPYPMQPYGGYGYLPPPPGYPYSSYPPPSSAPLPGSSAGLPHHGHLEQLHDEDHGSQAGGSVKRGRGGSGDEVRFPFSSLFIRLTHYILFPQDEGESKGKRKKRLPLSCGECCSSSFPLSFFFPSDVDLPLLVCFQHAARSSAIVKVPALPVFVASGRTSVLSMMKIRCSSFFCLDLPPCFQRPSHST